MPYKKKVQEVMIPLKDYPHIPHWFTLRQAVAIVRESAVKFAGVFEPRVVLVFNEKYQIVGLLPGGSQRFYGPVTATAPAIRSFALLPPRPNPMRGTTTLGFDLPGEGVVDLRIYDLLGRSIRRLSKGTMPVGRHEIVWDGRNDRGHPVASGIYLIRLGWRDRAETGRIVFLR